MAVAPFSWFLPLNLLLYFLLLPNFFTKSNISILFNAGSFAFQIGLCVFYMRKKRLQIKNEGTAYVLRELSKGQLKELKDDVLRGILFPGYFYAFFVSTILIVLVIIIVLLIGKRYVISFTVLLYVIEYWGYNFYFSRKKHRSDFLKEINLMIRQSPF